jgi:hypothetical protein
MADFGKLVTVGTKVLMCAFSNSAIAIEEYSDGGVLSSTPEETTITTIHSDNIVPGQYFMIYSPSNTYYVWYAKNNNEGEKPHVNYAVGLKVDLVTDDDAETVATKTAAVLNAVGGFTATAAGSVVTVVNTQGGPCEPPKDINTKFLIEVTVPGANKVLFDGTLGTNIHKVLDIVINADGSANIFVQTANERRFQRGMKVDTKTVIKSEIITTAAGWLF